MIKLRLSFTLAVALILAWGLPLAAQPASWFFSPPCSQPSTIDDDPFFTATIQLDGFAAEVGNDVVAFFNANEELVGQASVDNIFANGSSSIGIVVFLREDPGGDNCPVYTDGPVTAKFFDSSTGSILLAGNSIFNAVNNSGKIEGPDGTANSDDVFNFLSSSLPVTLTNFTATPNAATVALDWATSSETENGHFELERSTNPLNGFERIAKILGNATTTATNTYQYVDQLPGEGDNFYRIKQVDFDGNFTYSPVVIATLDVAGEVGLSVFPNPINQRGRLTIRLSGDWAKGATKLRLFDAAGLQVSEWTEQTTGSFNTELPELPAGVYLLMASDEQQRRAIRVLVR